MQNSLLKKEYKDAYDYYQNFIHEAGLPDSNVAGNGPKAILYSANGEASDYFLGELGRYAMSPELGTRDRRSEHFFIYDKEVLHQTLVTNDIWLNNAQRRLLALLKVSVLGAKFDANVLTPSGEREVMVTIKVENEGFVASPDHMNLTISGIDQLENFNLNRAYLKNLGSDILYTCADKLSCIIDLYPVHPEKFYVIELYARYVPDEKLQEGEKTNVFNLEYYEQHELDVLTGKSPTTVPVPAIYR